MGTVTLDVSTAVTNVEQAVEKVINDGDQFFPEAAAIGDAVRQGDVYIQFIGELDSPPVFYSKLKNPEFPFQLAPGNTKGSRHMLEASEGLQIWVCDVAKFTNTDNADFGLNFEETQAAREKFVKALFDYSRSLSKEAPEQARNWRSATNDIEDNILEALSFCGPIFVVKNATTVSHPEHGNWILPPGAYRVTFQRTLDQNMSIRRVLD